MAENDLINEDLEAAVVSGNFERFKVLLSSGANIHHTNDYRNSLLHLSKNVEISKELLLRGASVHVFNRFQETPLIFAIKRGYNIDVVRELLKHGACVHNIDRNGNTPLNLAVKKKIINLEVIKELLKYGSDIHTRNHERRLHDNYSSPLENAPCKELLIKFTLIANFDEDYRESVCLNPKSRNYNTLSSYLDDCACEILQMKTHVINNNVTLFEIVENFFGSDKFSQEFDGFQASMCSCASKEYVPCSNQMSMKLKSMDFKGQYPIYNDILLDVIEPFLVKADLLTRLSEVQIYTELDISSQADVKNKNRIILNDPITYSIADYLYNDDLSNFITAFSLKRSFEPDTNSLEASTSKRVKLS